MNLSCTNILHINPPCSVTCQLYRETFQTESVGPNENDATHSDQTQSRITVLTEIIKSI
jgi:hypothetical protein